MAPDTLAFTPAFYRRFGAERPFFQLAHHLVVRAPWLSLLRKYGTIEATWENSVRERPCSSTPGETGRRTAPPGTVAGSSSLAARIRPAGAGRARAHRPGGVDRRPGDGAVPHAPGGYSRALRLDRRFRLKVFPVSLALLWGLDVGDLVGHIALPAKITIQVLEPIDVHGRFGPNPDVDTLYAQITGLMQETLDGLAAQRRWPLIG